MHLSPHHVHAIAARGRSLSDDVLARLVLDHVLSEAVAGRRVENGLLDEAPVETPPVILTEQRFDGASHQKLVKVERRGRRVVPVPAAEVPRGGKMKAREDAFVAYVYDHPGCSAGDVMTSTGWARFQFNNASLAARTAERVEMRGDDKRSMRYWPKAEK